MKNTLDSRKEKYFKLNTHLAHLDNEQLNALFDGEQHTRGWGVNHRIKIRGIKVFVKRIPVTETEFNQSFSTKNLFNLPIYYNYGVGSAGFGAFREIVSHIKTTNWVLADAVGNFPIMYHYRIVPRTTEPPALDMERYQRYVAYWGNDRNIEKYGIARRNAKYEAIIFLEYFPHNLWSWFPKNINRTDQIIDEMRDTITFLRQNGIIHFDVHFGNVVTEGDHFYLTDFGLVLDRNFDLSAAERTFFKRNNFYDYGELLYSVGTHVTDVYEALSDKKKKKIMSLLGLVDDKNDLELLIFLLDKIEVLSADNMLKLEKNFVETIIKYREIISMMSLFYKEMHSNDKKDTKFRNTKLKRLLAEVDFLPKT